MIFSSKSISFQNLLPAGCAILFLGISSIIIHFYPAASHSSADVINYAASFNFFADSSSKPSGAPNNSAYYILVAGIVIIAILIWLFLRTFLKLRTREKENESVLNALSGVILIISNQKRVVRMVKCSEELALIPEEETIGKSAYDIFDEDVADIMASVTDKCFETKETVTFDFSLRINDKELFFYGRLVYQSPTRAVFSAYDITDRKETEGRLIKSANKVKEMNDVKDRFFSIIAHDLRSPVGSFKMLTGILLKNLGMNDLETTRKVLSSIHLASSNLYDLLENLLSWSHNQRKSLTLNLQNHGLYDLVDDAIDSQLVHSELKDIEISNDLKPECFARCDQYVTLTVIRNLISNAIKFTKKGGKIYVCCDHLMKDQKAYCKISVVDNGIGIPEEKIDTIFSFNPNKSTIGTNNESGSGLGLILCKEFIEKQEGFIEIHSVENEGTTISICLPTGSSAGPGPMAQEQAFLSELHH